MVDQSGKWDDINKRIATRRGASVAERPNHALGSDILPALAPASSPPTPQLPEPLTIIGRFRANQINRKLAVAQLSEYYDARMDLIRHQLKEAVRAGKAQATEAGDRYLMELNRSHLGFLAELGLKNVDRRQEILIELNERTAQRLADITSRDWPDFLKDQAVDEITLMNQDFAQRLRHELG
jgi:hypothetical protein